MWEGSWFASMRILIGNANFPLSWNPTWKAGKAHKLLARLLSVFRIIVTFLDKIRAGVGLLHFVEPKMQALLLPNLPRISYAGFRLYDVDFSLCLLSVPSENLTWALDRDGRHTCLEFAAEKPWPLGQTDARWVPIRGVEPGTAPLRSQ